MSSGCKENSPPQSHQDPRASQSDHPEAAATKDASSAFIETTSLPSLATAIKTFTSYERCLKDLQRSLPPELGADMLPYYDLPDVVCRTREAMAKNDPTACKRVISYTLIKGCELMHAMVTQQPDLCPMESPTRLGRDGYCLAMASRDASLCWGSRNEEEEARCRTILTGDTRHCQNLRRQEKQHQCLSEAKRWAGLFPEKKFSLPKDFQPKFELTLRMLSGDRPLPFDKVNLNCADQGAIAPAASGKLKMILCEYYPYGYRSKNSVSYDSPESRTRISFQFLPPKSHTAKLTFPQQASLAIRISGFDELMDTQRGEIRFETFEHCRGGRIKGSFKAIFKQGDDELEADGNFDTFIRDLISPTELRTRP